MATKVLKDYGEQVTILSERGCVISDREKAKEFLSTVSYYRLSGYFLPFKHADNTFKPNTTFERIVAVYEFDSRLRVLLYRVIGDIEIAVRTTIAHVHAQHYGALGYMDVVNFSNLYDHGDFLKQFERTIESNKKSLIVQHHINKYQGSFPIWVAAEFFTLGALSHFYSNLLPEVRREIAGIYGTKSEYFGSWLQCLTVLRNFCAHYRRLNYELFSISPKLPKNLSIHNGHRIFTQLLAVKLLYRTQPEKWNAVVVELSALVGEYNLRCHS